MRKSLIKSLLPVLIVVLALSMISITAVAEEYVGYTYDPENPCETIPQYRYTGLFEEKYALEDEDEKDTYDGLGIKGQALEKVEKDTYDGLDEPKYALEPKEDKGVYDGLNEPKCALEPAEDKGVYDGLGVKGQPLECEVKGTYDGLGGEKTALEDVEDNGTYDGLREDPVCTAPTCPVEDGLADDIDGLA